MEDIFDNLVELEGVRGAFLFDRKGRFEGGKVHQIYDQSILSNAIGPIMNAIDSMSVQYGDLANLSVHFSEGKLVLRRVGKWHILAVIADATINSAFANIAINVAEKKLSAAIEKGELPKPSPVTATTTQAPVAPVPGSMQGGARQAASQNQATREFLDRCTKALAQSVGPIAKLFVQEASNRFSAGLTRSDIPAFLELLEQKIDSAVDKQKFRQMLGY